MTSSCGVCLQYSSTLFFLAWVLKRSNSYSNGYVEFSGDEVSLLDCCLFLDQVALSCSGAISFSLDQFLQIEYILVHFDDDKKLAQLSLCAPELLPRLQQKERDAHESG